ncbi:sugar ABC transporter substrate-binding protein [Rubrobacter calidifluminis]|uniref:sugar ABC transporter substrate-binding protein n=1 Tax=Rubrobacter calidifluminis TaxID=1392640 RepID=UPI002361DD6F|nr:sugar ABC transporter substrate-binding protein [Rubrobacter calidifluminis]
MSGERETSRMEISRRDLLRAGGVGIAGTVLLGAAGCGGSQQASSSKSGGKQGLVSRGDIHIEMPTHMIPPDPNTAIMQNGAEQAARDMGVSVKFRGPDQFSMPQIRQIFESSIASNPSGIAATLPDASALGPEIRKAVNKGIPVVLFNAGLDHWKQLGALTYFGQTEYEAGVEAGKRMAQAGVKSALVINHQQGQLTLETRYRGVKKGLGGSVKEVAVDGSDPTAMRNGTASALKQNPDVDGLITLGPEAAVQALRAIKSVGRSGQVKAATFDISPEVLKDVRDGNLLFAIDQQMFLQTYLSVVTLTTYIQYLLSPVSAVPTGPDFVIRDMADKFIKLSRQGIH